MQLCWKTLKQAECVQAKQPPGAYGSNFFARYTSFLFGSHIAYANVRERGEGFTFKEYVQTRLCT